jgi:hypothetical protein
MAVLRAAFERDGYLYAISARNPSYALLLSRNGSSDAPWRVTSFDSGQPVGHREYNMLEGGGPTQNAYGEFGGSYLVLTPRSRRRPPSPAPKPLADLRFQRRSSWRCSRWQLAPVSLRAVRVPNQLGERWLVNFVQYVDQLGICRAIALMAGRSCTALTEIHSMVIDSNGRVTSQRFPKGFNVLPIWL